jgi:hypothetical protein
MYMTTTNRRRRGPGLSGVKRTMRVTGDLDFNGNDRSNWDVEQDIKKSLLWPPRQRDRDLKCPADWSSVSQRRGLLWCAACR